MTEHSDFNIDLNRRKLLAAAGIGTGIMMASTITSISNAKAAAQAASNATVPDAAMPAVSGLHLQFGANAASEVTVTWHTLSPVKNPRVVLGRPDGRTVG